MNISYSQNLVNTWSIASDADFEREALQAFRYQAVHSPIYRDFLRMIECPMESIHYSSQIPHLPIELFKSCDIYSAEQPPQTVFTSSSTGGGGESRHMMCDLEIYESAFTLSFERFYGDISNWSLYALLPSYLEREGSSLIYMVDHLVKRAAGGGFYLYDHEKLLRDMSADPNPKILLGVSYALWELAERHPTPLRDTIVMETGGMKGHREEISKGEFHAILCNAFGVDKIHSEYGMAELTSQAYSQGDNLFAAPPWMRVSIRDINDPRSSLSCGAVGGVNITDLASLYSCPFIATQDLGRTFGDGRFTIEGRIAMSDIRGCNLLVQS